MRAAFAILCVVAAGCATRAPLPPPAAAPPVETAPEPAAAPPRLAALEGLLELGGKTTLFHYSPGTLDRAAHLQSRLEALAESFWKLRGELPPIEAWVLDRETWEKAELERAYGLPLVVAPVAYALPGWGDPDLVSTVGALLGGPAPPLRGVPLRGTAEEGGALAVSDALFQAEAAYDFVAVGGIEGEAPWIVALVGQVFNRVAYERFEPGRMPEIAGWFDAIAAAHGGPRAFRLADYHLGQPFEVELWYQAQLLRGADVIWVEEGPRGCALWLQGLLRDRKLLTRAALEKRFPGLLDWERNSFAP